MKSFARKSALLCGTALGFMTTIPSAVWSNGDVFFEAEEIPGQTEYVVFGSVKDQSGRQLDNVTVTIDVSEPHLTYDAYTNVLGRFRTLDIGRAVKDLGFEMDAAKVTLTVLKPGYKLVSRLNRGRISQNKGAVEVNFVMAEDKNTVAAASTR